MRGNSGDGKISSLLLVPGRIGSSLLAAALARLARALNGFAARYAAKHRSPPDSASTSLSLQKQQKTPATLWWATDDSPEKDLDYFRSIQKILDHSTSLPSGD